MKLPIFGAIAFVVAFSAIARTEESTSPSVPTSNERRAEQEHKDDVDHAIDDAAHSTKSAIDSAKESAINAIENARRAVKGALERAKPHIGSSIEKAKQAASDALDRAKQATEEVLDKARDATEDALGTAKEAAGAPSGAADNSVGHGAHPANAGQATYMAYCALCHGLGTGPGMLAEALKKPAPDLTEIAKRNGGIFPRERVEAFIRDGGVTGHGTMRLLAWEKQQTP